MKGIDPKTEQKEAQAENSGTYTFESLVNGMPVISAGAKTTDHAFFSILRFISSRITVHPTFANSKPVTYNPRLKKLMPVVNTTSLSACNGASPLLCFITYRTVTSTQIQPVTWPVRYLQPKQDTIHLYPQAASLSFLRFFLHIVVV